MMINKRLIKLLESDVKYILYNVAFQWVALIINIIFMSAVTAYLGKLMTHGFDGRDALNMGATACVALVVRYGCAVMSAKMSYMSSRRVKLTLRTMIYDKLARLGMSYLHSARTSEVVQISTEGVEQLESYFGSYLPQFIFALLAPVTLFAYLSFISFKSAILLLMMTPLIPIAIAAVAKFAKKLLKRYWGEYTTLGDSFLENLQGLTTLKIYRADEIKNREMNAEAERFRIITMKVLAMQLNSITIMDLVAFGGAALGVIVSVVQYNSGNITFEQCLLIILLSADFFIPMRLLGSYFHIAMNGMAASDNIFRLLDLPESKNGDKKMPEEFNISLNDVSFSYDGEAEVLKNVSMEFAPNRFTAIVGESGSGKSTLSGLITLRNRDYSGAVRINDAEISEYSEAERSKSIVYIGHKSYIFAGSVRDNLQMAKRNASDDELWKVLDKVRLSDFVSSCGGLDMRIDERASNLSGGQAQRLSLARALLHDGSVYIFDEATSNIDVESENYILEEINELASNKSVIMISHRLANVVRADLIYVMKDGVICESGTHEQLLAAQGEYEHLWNAQQSLEDYGKGGRA